MASPRGREGLRQTPEGGQGREGFRVLKDPKLLELWYILYYGYVMQDLCAVKELDFQRPEWGHPWYIGFPD